MGLEKAALLELLLTLFLELLLLVPEFAHVRVVDHALDEGLVAGRAVELRTLRGTVKLLLLLVYQIP